ncbi:MAG: sigma-70 family RNA polymerase sigma factor [Proteobacteria bacterium]|nr:sigma-70 family RNA polymerase sigma factor [Pseudomonadota bacterium]
MSDPAEFTHTSALLAQWAGGDKRALDDLLSHLYRDIHAIATRQLRSERGLTIRPTALVHEVYLRLKGLNELRWNDRAHFLSMAARVTRQALVDEARRRRADKRSGGAQVTLNDENLGGTDTAFDALHVDDLLNELKGFDEVAAEVVSLRVFGGLSVEEVAEVLAVSVATVHRRWASGKTWLAHELLPPA